MKMRSEQQKLHWQHQKVEKQAKTCQNQQNAKNSGEPAQHEPHSITSQRTDARFIYLYIYRYRYRWLFSSLWPCGAPSARSGQGQPSEMRVPGCAACSGVRIFILWQCFVRLRSRHAGCWWMVLSIVLYMVLSDTLADRCMARRQQVRWKGCFTFTYFYWDFSGLLQVGLFLVAVHVIFPFVFCLWEGAGISSKKVPKVRKDFIHTGRQTKNATEDESNLQTHACKLVFTNTRQQATMSDNRKTKTQVKKYRRIS